MGRSTSTSPNRTCGRRSNTIGSGVPRDCQPMRTTWCSAANPASAARCPELGVASHVMSRSKPVRVSVARISAASPSRSTWRSTARSGAIRSPSAGTRIGQTCWSTITSLPRAWKPSRTSLALPHRRELGAPPRRARHEHQLETLRQGEAAVAERLAHHIDLPAAIGRLRPHLQRTAATEPPQPRGDPAKARGSRHRSPSGRRRRAGSSRARTRSPGRADGTNTRLPCHSAKASPCPPMAVVVKSTQSDPVRRSRLMPFDPQDSDNKAGL